MALIVKFLAAKNICASQLKILFDDSKSPSPFKILMGMNTKLNFVKLIQYLTNFGCQKDVRDNIYYEIFQERPTEDNITEPSKKPVYDLLKKLWTPKSKKVILVVTKVKTHSLGWAMV